MVERKKPSYGKSKGNDPTTAVHAFFVAPRKSLGQHFLSDGVVVGDMVAAAEQLARPQQSSLNCCEIGPGTGVLTMELLKRNWKVTAIERDDRVVEELQKTLAVQYASRFEIVHSDVLRWKPPEVSPESRSFCIGNLPYYVVSDILFWFLEHQKSFVAGIFMVQKEVAERLVAAPSTREYGRLSVRLQLAFDIKKIIDVPASSFVPPPKVDSAVISLVPRNFDFGSPEDNRALDHLTTILFSARRKMLRRALRPFVEDLDRKNPGFESVFWRELASLGVEPEMRPDTLSPIVIFKIHKMIQGLKK